MQITHVEFIEFYAFAVNGTSLTIWCVNITADGLLWLKEHANKRETLFN